MTIEVTEEEYKKELEQGFTDDETLKPGTYKVRRSPWAQKLKGKKLKVSIYLDADILEYFLCPFNNLSIVRRLSNFHLVLKILNRFIVAFRCEQIVLKFLAQNIQNFRHDVIRREKFPAIFRVIFQRRFYTCRRRFFRANGNEYVCVGNYGVLITHRTHRQTFLPNEPAESFSAYLCRNFQAYFYVFP